MRKLLVHIFLGIWLQCYGANGEIVQKKNERERAMVIAGQISGHLIAFDAWTGEMITSFDSGGPLIAECDSGWKDDNAKVSSQNKDRNNDAKTSTSTSLVPKDAEEDHVFVPSLDGRIFHLSKRDQLIQDVMLTTSELLQAKAPVQSMHPDLKDILFVGEKKQKLFTFDTSNGKIYPFVHTLSPKFQASVNPSNPQNRNQGRDKQHLLLFGRSDLTTKMFSLTNGSNSKCMTVSEYFIQFSSQSQCESSNSPDFNQQNSPIIDIVMAGNANGGTALSVYDPLSNQMLWSWESVFDLTIVYGIFPNNGHQFYEWKVSGPTPNACIQDSIAPSNELVASFQNKQVTPSKQIYAIDKHSKSTSTAISSPNPSSYDTSSNMMYRYVNKQVYMLPVGTINPSATPNKTSRFWKSVEKMERNGKNGYFITNQHIAVSLLIICISCFGVGYVCYWKGISTFLNSKLKTKQIVDNKSSENQQHDSFKPTIHSPVEVENSTTRRTSNDGIVVQKLKEMKSPVIVHRSLSWADFRDSKSANNATVSSPHFNSLKHENSLPVFSPLQKLNSFSISNSLVRVAQKLDMDPLILDSTRVLLLQKSTGLSDGKSVVDAVHSEPGEELVELPEKDGYTTQQRDSSANSSDIKPFNAQSNVISERGNELYIPFVCFHRFRNEFEELSILGKGGFGQVMLAENRLDGRQYAIKRVGLSLKNKTEETLDKFLREVKILARLDHSYIVRYYQAWLEEVSEQDAITMSTQEDSINQPTASVLSYSKLPPSIQSESMDYTNRDLFHRDSLAQLNDSLSLEYKSTTLSQSHYSDGFDWDRGSEPDECNFEQWSDSDIQSTDEPVVSTSQFSRKPHNNVVSKRNSNENRESSADSNATNALNIDHWLYIQMQYCCENSLADYLGQTDRKIDIPKMMNIFHQIASALEHVHNLGLIHRDLKPANIFIMDQTIETIKLGDFGLSRYANTSLHTTSTGNNVPSTTPNSCVSLNSTTVLQSNINSTVRFDSQDNTGCIGTFLYASPEQMAGEKYNSKTDIYSLGMILFELCCEPYGTAMERIVTLRNIRDYKLPSNWFVKDLYPDIVNMIMKLIVLKPVDRPNSSEIVKWSQELTSKYNLSATVTSPSSSDSSSHVHKQMDDSINTHKLIVILNSADTKDSNETSVNHDVLLKLCTSMSEKLPHVKILSCGLNIHEKYLEFSVSIEDNDHKSEILNNTLRLFSENEQVSHVKVVG